MRRLWLFVAALWVLLPSGAFGQGWSSSQLKPGGWSTYEFTDTTDSVALDARSCARVLIGWRRDTQAAGGGLTAAGNIRTCTTKYQAIGTCTSQLALTNGADIAGTALDPNRPGWIIVDVSNTPAAGEVAQVNAYCLGGLASAGSAVVTGPSNPRSIVMDDTGSGALERTDCTIGTIGGLSTGISCTRPAGTATAIVLETEDNTAGTPLDKTITLTAPVGVPAGTANRTITAGTDLVFGFERSIIQCPEDGTISSFTFRCLVPHAGTIVKVFCLSNFSVAWNAGGGALNVARVDTSGTVHSLSSSTQTIPSNTAAEFIIPAPVGPTVTLAAGEQFLINSPTVGVGTGALCTASFISA